MSFFDQFKIRTRSAQDTRTRKSGRVDELSALVRERPDDWAAENELADALARDGRIDAAVTRLCALGDRMAAEGFVVRAHAIYKKALRLQPQDNYAASRAAALNTERINQPRSRFGSGITEAPSIEPAAADAPTVSPAPVAAAVVAPAPSFVIVPTSQSEPQESLVSTGATDPDTSSYADEPCEPGCTADMPPIPDSDEPATVDVACETTAPVDCDAPKTIDEILRDASLASTNNEIETAVRMLKDCARMHPDVLEPVDTLAEIAATHGLADVRDEAEARLCDLHCRRGDYHAARRVAEALAMRYPDDVRHRARLEFVEAELEECAVLDTRGSMTETETLVAAPDHTADTPPAPGDSRSALERAAAAEEHCFAASRELARFDAEAGDWTGALAWLERAATAIPGPTDEEALAYEIAVVLEGAGEHDRALGVLSEIAAKAGAEYRDVSERIVRLSSVRRPIREQLVAP